MLQQRRKTWRCCHRRSSTKPGKRQESLITTSKRDWHNLRLPKIAPHDYHDASFSLQFLGLLVGWDTRHRDITHGDADDRAFAARDNIGFASVVVTGIQRSAARIVSKQRA